ncbi:MULTISPECIES: DUF2953 domain-containing protein [Lachnospiraceae]|uniref:DUF2953 domain-containing protein n=1 Tax=Lachnospiraceae TaxID=186803 RepID=UPI000E475CC0|nr:MULTISPECIES: DUF2953 domain-containing protein [Lachnospiraceae]NSD21687.1 DUF2953 domain-containing protein [Fusicatenibacter saccharivorans]NSD78393.1 DUF2953 domain-containing protein [Fusicatenibacter saccharivorans]NSE25819.1 DUF2953 domain-containing protein [Fusicatenibacter saccharivorans]RGF69653.1 DUF2953 domain-containing protein [Blautia sp. AF32-4BH]RGG19743.1 DUF2953 domain-containing protein [Blautia sp. AF26-2]
MIHILFMILKALGILLLVLLFLVLLIVCTVLFLPFCYRAQVLKEEEGFACVKASGRVSWLFGAVALTASYEEQKPEAQILLFGASLETWKRRLKKIRRGEASVPRTEENETENAPEAEKTAEQKAPDQKEKQQKVTAQKEQPEQEQEPDAPKKSILERFFGRIEYLPEKLLNLASRLLQTAFRLLELPFRLLEKLEQKIQAGRRLKRKWESVKKFFRSKMFREALLHAKKEVLYFLKKAAPKKVTGTVRFGFNDPALTGETLGILGMIYGKLPKDLSIQPDFEQEILQGDVRMKGSFQAVTAAGIALRLFRDQNLRKTIRHFKHKEA